MYLGDLKDYVITDNGDGTKKIFKDFGDGRTVTIHRALIDYKNGTIEGLPEEDYSKIFTLDVEGFNE